MSLVVKDLEISNSIDSSFPMDKLAIFQQNIFELEISLLGNKWLLADPVVTAGPLEMHADLFPIAKLLGRSNHAN